MTDEANNADYLKNSPDPNHVQTSGEQEADTSGISEFREGALMMNISPENGNALLIPWSRLEKITVNHDATEITLFASDAIVVIQGQELIKAIPLFQRASVYSITEGSNNRNGINIDSIAITYASDSE